jgi:hypothetical protein
MTYGSVFDSKSAEITTLVHFSAACLAMRRQASYQVIALAMT